MNRWLILLPTVWLTLTPLAASASSVSWGLEAGVSLSRFAFDDPERLPLPEERYGNTLWIRGGLRARLPLDSKWAVVGGLTYESNGVDVKLAEGLVGTSRLDYATLPVAVELAVPTGTVRPFGRAGIDVGVLVDADEFAKSDGERLGDGADNDDSYPAFESTVLVGAGLRLQSRWDAHVTYRYGLTNVNDTRNRNEHRVHNRSLALGVTYWFGGIVI